MYVHEGEAVIWRENPYSGNKPRGLHLTRILVCFNLRWDTSRPALMRMERTAGLDVHAWITTPTPRNKLS